MSKDLPDQPEQVIGQSGDRLIRHGGQTDEEIKELGRQMNEGEPADFSSLNRAANLVDPEAQSIATQEAIEAEARAADKADKAQRKE